MDESAAFYPFRPYAEYVWCAPFWTSPVYIPLERQKRFAKMTELATKLNDKLTVPINRWLVEDLSKSADPWRLQRRRGYRLVAELQEETFITGHIQAALLERYPGFSVRCLSTRLCFDDYGLGAFESTFALSAREEELERWKAFLLDRETWANVDFATIVLESQLRVQASWPDIVNALVATSTEIGQQPLNQLDMALGQVSAQEIVEGNGLLWTQCMDMTLFWNDDMALDVANIQTATGLLHEIGLVMDYTMNVERTQTPAGHVNSLAVETTAYAIALGSNMFLAMYNGFGMVALVREKQPWRSTLDTEDEEFNPWWSPSRRIAALRRTMLINYGAMTTASSILTQYLRQTLLVSGPTVLRVHDELRQLTAVFSILKHEARRELIECDDLESYVYKAIYEMWGLPSQIDVLNEAIEDTDRAASRLSEYNIHREERAFSLALLFLTIATMGGIAAETVHFTFHPEEFSIFSPEVALRAFILIAVWLIALAVAIRYSVAIRHSDRRFPNSSRLLRRPRWLTRVRERSRSPRP